MPVPAGYPVGNGWYPICVFWFKNLLSYWVPPTMSAWWYKGWADVDTEVSSDDVTAGKLWVKMLELEKLELKL